MNERLVMSWSGGKDGALALHELVEGGAYHIEGLLTTLTAGEPERIQMHGQRRELLERQARALGIPLITVVLPPSPSNGAYAEAMSGTLLPLRRAGLRHIGFGDVHLADLRAWREHNLISLGMKGVFPLWRRDSRALVEKAVAVGIRAVICCVDPERLPPSFLGRELTEQLLAELPEGVDPCGENGEFHTFVHAGPGFASPVAYRLGERFERDGFAFQDLLPG